MQVYTRARIGPTGPLPVAERTRQTTLTGWEYFPEAARGVGPPDAAQVHRGMPLLVTENGIATADDDRPHRATPTARCAALHAAIADGIDVRGYFHWSLLDNFEWVARLRGPPSAWSRSTGPPSPARRSPAPAWLGDVARANALA